MEKLTDGMVCRRLIARHVAGKRRNFAATADLA
jgi:hypothetical protein